MRPAGGPGVQPNILQRAGSPRWKDLPGPNVSSANVGTPCPCDKWCGDKRLRHFVYRIQPLRGSRPEGRFPKSRPSRV